MSRWILLVLAATASLACAKSAATATTGTGGSTVHDGAVDGDANAPGGSGGKLPDAGAGGATSGTGGANVSTGGTPQTGGVAGATAGTGGVNVSTGGTPQTGGSAGAAADAGAVDSSVGMDMGTPGICSFAIAGALSPVIPTVGIIDWSTDLAGLSEARIEFTLNDPADGVLNRGSGGRIDIAGSMHRALMLGLKAERTYTYRIVATGGGKVCTSPDHRLTTGASTGAPTVTRAAQSSAERARGFIVTSNGYPGFSAAINADHKKAYVIDADGDVVWWADAPAQCSRALIDWEGATLWMMATNTSGSNGNTGDVRRIGMDGAGALDHVEGLLNAHHDLTVLPGGIVATLAWAGGAAGVDNGSDLVERLPDGTIQTVIRLGSKVFKSNRGGTFHANSILYHPTDDTYTVGDLYAGAYVKVTRQGKLLWQLGGDCSAAPAPKCARGDWTGNHGHHLLDDGTLFLFEASATVSTSTAYGYGLIEAATSLKATQIWSYQMTNVRSVVLGDIQRLPNGNTLVIFSTDGQMHEVSPSGDLVQTITANAFGYANFRETMYGPPLR